MTLSVLDIRLAIFILTAVFAIINIRKHEKTLEAMRQNPKLSNLRWADVESLLVHCGARIREGKGSAISVSLNDKRAYFHRPHPGDKADKGRHAFV
jgi:hypothetical protein